MILHEGSTILVVDDDKKTCILVSEFLKKHNYKVRVANCSEKALTLIQDLKPDVILVDVNLPTVSGLEFLKLVRQQDKLTPVIVVADAPDMTTVMEAIHNGAQDYMVKPLQLTSLEAKISQTLDVVHSHRHKQLLSELVSLHSISNKLASTQNYDEVLDIAFEACLGAVKAEHGYLMIADNNGESLNLVRVRGEYHGSEYAPLADKNDWPDAKWVFRNNRAIALYDGYSAPFKNLPFAEQVKGVSVLAPIRVGDKPLGVVCMSREVDDGRHGKVEMNLLEILAAQTGTALNNAGLYEELSQRVNDLHLISNYAEQFVGIVEPENVVTSFIDTIRDYFDVDFVGALLIEKRSHPLLNWSRHLISEDEKKQIVDDALDCFNSNSSVSIEASSVRWNSLITDYECGEFCESFEYTKLVPLVWGEFEFGAIVLKWLKQTPGLMENLKLLRGIINQTRIALTNAKLFSDIKENYIRTIKALAIAVDAKDTYTHGHSENVMLYSEILARYIGLPEEEVQIIKNGGLLHDIGKIGIPGYILNKPGPLTDAEYNGVMKTHPAMGADIIKDVPFLQSLKPVILYHHEHHDGTGYPNGLKGDEIPMGAQIVHIADAFEAMTSNRPYRKSLGQEEAVKRLKSAAGTQFNAALVDNFLEAMMEAGKISVEVNKE